MSEGYRALAAALAVVVAAMLLRITNLKREIRGRQVIFLALSPILAAALSVLAIRWFDRLSFSSSSLFYGCEILVWNLLITAAFLIVRLPLLLAAKLLGKNQELMQSLAGAWYEYDDAEEAWFLRQRCWDLRIAWNAVTGAATLICAAALAAVCYFGPGGPLWLRVFPCAALIVITEIYSFLAGYTREEYLREFGGQGIRAARITNYGKLRYVYERLFPDALLAVRSGSGFGNREGAGRILRELAESADPAERLVSGYFSRLRRDSGVFNVDMISAANKLLHGESVVVMDPFYRDLNDYVLLPLMDCLIHNRKCLVIVGRETQKEDASAWVETILRDYSRTRALWRVRPLNRDEPDCEVGVLSFSQIYDLGVQTANTEFLSRTGFVLMLEPSRMLTTSQAGLGLVAEKLNREKPPVYCICDHDTDGLVDTLSHVLQTNITNVVAAPVPKSGFTVMGWAAEGEYDRQKLFDKQTHYLGNGVELAAVALKHQVPKVTWYGADKAPVQDIRWLAGQYYAQICKYANIPSQQKALEERISFRSNLWGSPTEQDAFVIAEDEFCNLFATLRAFMTRGENQSFVNVIAENYLLRDYMRFNAQMFMSDPKIIPAIAPHYAKTERNTVFRLILMMVCAPVDEDYVAHELSLLGYESDDVYRSFSELMSRYSDVDGTVISVRNEREINEEMVPILVTRYRIPQEIFDARFASTLKNAYIVVEDEKLETDYIDARLFGHLTQCLMPGQLVTYNGKLYRVHSVKPQVGCILHRAADDYNGRLYYRQLRRYCFDAPAETVRVRRLSDIEIATEQRSFSVTSAGYLQMPDSHDLRGSRRVDLSDDPDIENYVRRYKNKNVLRLRLPDTDESTRFTLALLLNESFRTLFPDAWPYLAVLCADLRNVEGGIRDYVYHLEGDFDPELIYVVEDSDMDLGLLEAVDEELPRIFEILADYLRWHFEKIREPDESYTRPQDVLLPEEERKQSRLQALLRRVRRIAGLDGEQPEEAEKEPGKKKRRRRGRKGEDAPTETQSGEQPETDGGEAPDRGEGPETDGGETPDKGAQPETDGGEAPDRGEGPETDGGETPDKGAQPETDGASADAGDREKPAFDGDDGEETDSGALRSTGDGAAALSAGFDPGGRVVDRPQSAPVEKKPDPEIASAIPEDDGEDPELVVHGEGDSFFAPGGLPDDLDILIDIKPSRYQRECYLKLGFDEINEHVALESVHAFLRMHGWGENALTRARKPFVLDAVNREMAAENHCDFCGHPLTGVSYERLADGRVRCADCAGTAVDGLEAFVDLFRRTEAMMETIFQISVKANIRVRTADARTIGSLTGHVFQPSTEVAARVLGFAQRKHGRYTLYVENGSPRLAAIDTITHEMTHIWQYLNWKESEINSLYSPGLQQDLVYEGMAVWAAVQMLYALGESHYAAQTEEAQAAREDIYGVGFRLYRDRYGLMRNGEEIVYSPFTVFPPL